MEGIAHPKVGMQTSNNEKYLRMWFEINYSEFCGSSFGLKWIKYLKGGAYRKWYGNLEYLLRYNNDPQFILNQKNARVLDLSFLKKRKCTWTDLTSGGNSFRYAPEDTFYDISGHCFFPEEKNQYWLLAYANTNVFSMLLKVFNSTFHCQVGDVAKIVVPNLNENTKVKISDISMENVKKSQIDWDSFETSWDFTGHPLIKAITKYPSMMERGNVYLTECYDIWAAECEERFAQLKANEEELNRIFIDIYGLQDELTPEVEDKDVTVRKADLQRDVKSLLSYAVGCLFGRYAPETDGLMYAGGAWDESRYHLIHPVKDNVLPLCDEEYFGDNDLVNRVVEFIKEVFGASSLEDNLAFIAKALGNKGNTSREIIRNYFLKDFYADHCKIYQKRPIYWMFDSGKKNGFKALVYLHRWDADTTGRVYNNYLSPLLRTYAQQIEQEKNVYANSKDARASSLAQKRIDKLTLQQDECKTYEKDIAHLAALRIALDLDDGVKVNYVKAQTAADGKNLNVLVPIK